MILQQQLQQGRMYAKLREYRHHLQFAQAGIVAMLEMCPQVYLSLSFGKQSLVLAHMLWQHAPSTPMFFLASSETWLMHDFGAVIDAFMQRCPINLTIHQTNNAAMDIASHVAWLHQRQPSIHWCFKPPGDPVWDWKQTRDYGDNDLQEMVSRDDYDGWFWGLAKEESRARAITLSNRWEGQPHPSIYRYSDGKHRGCPLMFWKTLDLAAYIQQHDLPLLNEYQLRGLEARTTARITKRAVENGFVSLSAHYNLSMVNAICARFPELRGDT